MRHAAVDVMVSNESERSAPIGCKKQHFCFFWQERGNFAAPGLYPTLADALRTMHEIERSGCGCPFEQCVRDPDGSGPINWYEPCEPALAEAGLPWFYFTPGPHTLIPELYSQGRLETNQENAIFSSPFQLTSELTIDDDEIILVIPHDADLFFSYMEHD